ncbi:MAG: DNA polymerase III subunit delta' [Lachnospiraceae bacterium]|jgi:DNA polymerase-3 subunit delta'|nr:DNA polymerase III subunit delta' [Lachnospiraceae bacterium]
MSGFSDFLGNERIKEYFARTLANGQISHAYILAGEAGMGRKTLAKAFAMTLLCEKNAGGQNSGEPCGVCHSCKQFLSDNHPDVTYITHEKKGIGVDDIRTQLNGTVQIKPYGSAYKIYIMDEAEKMTTEAQNALLKTLEEPPSYVVIFLLTTRPDSFLPTILSRCITLKLKPLYDAVIHEYLTERLHVGKSDADICTAFARGNLGRAVTLSTSEEFGRLRRSVTSLLRQIHSMDLGQLVEVLRQWKEDQMDMDECLDFMQLWYRDVLLFKATQDTAGFIFKDEYKTIRDISAKSSFHGIEEILEGIERARQRLGANVNFELTMELMLLTIKEN